MKNENLEKERRQKDNVIKEKWKKKARDPGYVHLSFWISICFLPLHFSIPFLSLPLDSLCPRDIKSLNRGEKRESNGKEKENKRIDISNHWKRDPRDENLTSSSKFSGSCVLT